MKVIHLLQNFPPEFRGGTEIYVTDVLWPDFEKAHFDTALDFFARRERRYGGLGPEPTPASSSTIAPTRRTAT